MAEHHGELYLNVLLPNNLNNKMSDAAAFFASKKKKKFKKFNANLVDANTLARTVHVYEIAFHRSIRFLTFPFLLTATPRLFPVNRTPKQRL